MKALLVFAALIAMATAVPFTAANCTAFCNTVDNTCGATFGSAGGAANIGYNGLTLCNAFCQFMVAANFTGDSTNTSGNTMGCRAYHVGVASANASNAAIHCPHVSLTGGGVCGTPLDRCATYCALQAAGCPETFQNSTGTFQINICMAACAGSLVITTGAPQQGGYNMSGSEYPFDQGSDSLQCRTYHTMVATLSGTSGANTTHCPHGSPLGGSVCGGAQQAIVNFCADTQGVCGLGGNILGRTGLWPYTSIAQCISDAANYSQAALSTQYGAVNAASGDSLGCRFYHGSVPSFLDPVTHCPHTGWASSPCGARSPTPAPGTTTTAPTTTKGALSTAVASVGLIAAALVALF